LRQSRPRRALRPLVRKLRQYAIRFVEQDDARHGGAVAKAGEMRNDVVGNHLVSGNCRHGKTVDRA
jgi:hypothetical protein